MINPQLQGSMLVFCILISLTSNLAVSTITPRNPSDTSTPPTIKTASSVNAPTPNSTHQYSLIHKLNQLANYIYNGLDYIAEGQQNLTITQYINQQITTLTLYQLKQQNNLLKADLMSYSEAIRWDQKVKHAALKSTIQTAFDAIKFECEDIVIEQRNLKSEQRSGFNGLIAGQSNLTAVLTQQQSRIINQLIDLTAEQKSGLDGLETAKNNLTTALTRQQSDIIALRNQLTEQKSDLDGLKMENGVLKMGQSNLKDQIVAMKSENAILQEQIQLGLNNSKSELSGQLNELKAENANMHEQTQLGLNNSKAELRGHLNDLNAENAILHEQIELGLNNSKSELKVQLNDLKAENSLLMSQHKATKAELDVLKSQLGSVMKGVERLVKAIPPPTCEDGWTPFQDRCYKIVKKIITGDAVSAKCHNMGGKQIKVRSELENNFLAKTMKKLGMPHMWLGLKINQHNKYTWPDGTQYPHIYHNFYPGQPDGRTCVFLNLRKNNKWHSFPCAKYHRDINGYACEKPLGDSD